MLMKAEIVELGVESYQGKRGQVTTPVLTLLDRSEGPRCKNTLDFMLTEEQSAKLPTHDSAKLAGKPIEVGITDIRNGFGGRMRIAGVIVKI